MDHPLSRTARNIGRIGLVATALSVLIMGFGPVLGVERYEGQPEIVDADTFRFDGKKLRLWGVDAPESGQACLDASGKRYLCGSKAALALADWVGRRRMSCQQRETDRYGRPVVSCTVAGEDVAGWLARQGWARDYTRYSRGAYAYQESQARQARRGIWQGEHVAPWAWRSGERLQVEQASAPAGDCRIKGNVSGGGRIYHLPGSRHYERTRIDEGAGERWFCTPEEAEQAGWRAPRQ